MIVYHYTSIEAYNNIISSKKFFPSYLNPQMDTAFGEGWYFTKLSPETEDKKLQNAIWLKDEPTKCKRYLAFEIDDSLLHYCRPNVYRLKIDAIQDESIDLTLTYTYTQSKKQAIKYLRGGHKPIKNLWGVLGVIVLIGLGLWALSN
ncbi:hypothetical protein KAW65_04100 [candidate division WOR-3 bacterium]|nr:hypothetical protein [candidate division WOR-3 bacterium]